MQDTDCKNCTNGFLACDARLWVRTAYFQYSDSELVPLKNVIQLVNDFNFFDFEGEYTPADGRTRKGKFRKGDLIFKEFKEI